MFFFSDKLLPEGSSGVAETPFFAVRLPHLSLHANIPFQRPYYCYWILFTFHYFAKLFPAKYTTLKATCFYFI